MTTASPEHQSFEIVRTYPHSPDRVWSAWAILEKKRAWFGAGLDVQEFRVGGRESLRFADDMGEHNNETRYFEIKDRERIVFAYSMAMNGTIHSVSLATVTFEAEGSGTKVTYVEQMCVIPPSDGVDGRRYGWDALLTALGDWLDEATESAA